MFNEKYLQHEIDDIRRELREIWRVIHSQRRYIVTVKQQGDSTMANGIQVGSQGTFEAVLDLNGNAVAIPSTSTWTWTASDSSAVITTVSSDPTGGTVTVAIPAGDPSTTVTVTASTTDPTGATQSGSVTVPVTTAAAVYTVSVSQTA